MKASPYLRTAQIVRNVKSNSLKIRLITISLLLTIIPAVLVGLISYKKTYDTMLETTSSNALQMADQLANNTELSFYEMERFIDLGKSTTVISFLLNDDLDSRTYYAFEIIRMIDTYKKTYRFSSSVDEIKIIGVKNRNFSEHIGVFELGDAERGEYLNKLSDANGRMIISVQPDPTRPQDHKGLRILVGAPIYQIATNDLLGVIVLELDDKPFTDFTQSAQIGQKGYFSVADSNNIFLSETQTQQQLHEDEMRRIGQGSSGHFIRKTDGADELIIFSTVNQYNWKVIGRVFLSDIMSGANDIRRYTITIMAICLLIAIALNIFVVIWLFVPLDKLKHKMGLVGSGDLSVTLSHRSNDEIAQLNFAFNEMINEIRDLMNKNQKEQENLKKSQLRVLQAQINPHFLYNTLDVIIWLIHRHDNDKAVEIVDALSEFFRTALSKGKDFIRVSEEIKHVTSYLTIQKSRYHDILEFQIDVPEELKNCRIMKLMLQPLAENALYHGLKPKRGGGSISISGRREGDFLYFTVQDDGVGMEEAVLYELRQKLAQPQENVEEYEQENPDHGYGLPNIQQRIRLYYQGDCGLSIDSQAGKGTVVTLKIGSET